MNDMLTSKALSDIQSERQRQIHKGYDAANDDKDERGNHARAGSFYATAAYYQRNCGYDSSTDPSLYQAECTRQFVQRLADDASAGYPWDSRTKSVEHSARANLVKAAALLVAEIERIDREGVL